MHHMTNVKFQQAWSTLIQKLKVNEPLAQLKQGMEFCKFCLCVSSRNRENKHQTFINLWQQAFYGFVRGKQGGYMV